MNVPAKKANTQSLPPHDGTHSEEFAKALNRPSIDAATDARMAAMADARDARLKSLIERARDSYVRHPSRIHCDRLHKLIRSRSPQAVYQLEAARGLRA